MLFLFLLLLISCGGSMGGSASAIAQKHQGKTVSLSFLLENMVTGAAASISMFFLIESLFGLSPNAITKGVHSEQISGKANTIIIALEKESIVCAKLFSLSVAAGFAGIPLMNSLSKQLLSRVDNDEENNDENQDNQEKSNILLISEEDSNVENVDLENLEPFLTKEAVKKQLKT